MNLVQTAHDLMVEAHKCQTRRDKVTSYHTHPEKVRDIAFKWVYNVLGYTGEQPSVEISKLILKALNYSKIFGLNTVQFLELIEVLAYQHDIIEDCKEKGFTIDYLIERLSKFKDSYPLEFFTLFRKNLLTLTHDSKDSYLDYIVKVKSEPIASIIKIADMAHNISTLEPERKTNRDKYQLAQYIILN